MKEKIIKFMKTHKLPIGISLAVVCVAVVVAVVVGLVAQPDEDKKTVSKRPTTERVVMGPKTSILFYNNFEDLDRTITDGGSFAGGAAEPYPNVLERITGEDNNYLKMSYNKKEYCAYAATTTGADSAGTVLVEISLSTDGSAIPNTVLCYPYDRNTTNTNPRRNLFVIRQDGSIVVESATLEGVETTVATLEQGKWVKLGIKFTPSDGHYVVYTYNEATKAWDQKAANTNTPSVIDPSYMRFQILTNEDNVGTSILFDDFAVYTGSNFIDLSKVEMPKPIQVEVGEDVEMDHPEMADIGNEGIAVMAGKGYAYVGEDKVSLAANTSETEITVEEEESGIKAFFQSIIHFFKKLFGIKVEEHSETYKDILVSGDFIEKYLNVEVKDTSKLYAIGEIAKDAGKNVVYDDRGLVVITNPEIKLDAEEDVKLLTMLYGLFETGEVVSNYAAAPIFDQDVIDNAIDTYAAPFPEAFVGTTATMKSVNSLYYLTLVSRYYPDAHHSTKDVTVVDAALKKLRVFINGGGEPFASVGCWFAHGTASSAFTLIKNTDVIYSQLTEEEIDRMDTIMAAMAIAGNWGYNDANNYSTSFDLQGNFNDGANYRNSYLTVVLNASLYFGPEKLDEIFVNFNYDTYMAKFEEYGFTNIYNKWIDIGYNNAKELMEQGGDAYLIGQNGDYHATTVGKHSGTGKGVKLPFSYEGLGSEEVTEIFSEYLIAYTYAWKTISEYGTPDTISHCYIMSDNKKSPLEGQMGMMQEYASTDSGDIRSKTSYCYDSFVNVVPLYTNLKLLYGWDSSTQRMRELDNRIWVGNEDMIYKMIEGYRGRAISANYEEFEYQYVASGYEPFKDIWYNFHSMQNMEITITKDPEKVALNEIPEAEPKEGDGITPPEGAWEAVVKNGDQTMNAKSFYRFIEDGKGYETGKVEFEFVIPDGIDENNYNVVVMLDQQDKNRKYTDFNILFRLMSGWIEVYNGAASVSDYIPTDLRFGPNYRFHVEWEWDVANTCSQIKITQTWPATEKEVSYTSKKLKFRATGDSIQGINSLVLVKNDVGSPFWVENFKLVEAGKIVDIVESEPDLVRIPGAYYQNDFNDKDRKVSYNANSRAYNNEISIGWNADAKNGWLDMKIASTDQAYFRPKITGAKENETLVMELELSTDGKTPETRIMYPYKANLDAEKTSNNTIINITDNEVKCAGEHVATLSPGKWTRIGIIFTPATGECTVYEYNQSTDVYERRVEWEANPSVIAPTYIQFYLSKEQKKGNNLLVDDMSIYEGTEFYFDKKIDTTGVYVKSTKKNNIVTPEGYYYWSDYNVENCNVKYDAQIKSQSGYDYTQGLDSNGNGYMSIDSIDGMTTGSFFRAKVEGATNGDYIITEIDLRAGQNGTPGFTFMYDYNKVDGSTKAKTLFSVSQGKGRVLGGNALISSLSASKWTKIGVILNQKTGDYTVYEYDETTKTYVWKAEGSGTATQEGYPTFVGLNISAPSSPCSVHVDNFFVYGSNKASFKDGTTGTKPPFDGIYYSQDYSDADLWDVGVNFYNGGGNDYTRMVDADGNAYVKIASKKDSNAYDYFKVNLNEIDKDPNGSIVVEMALRAGKDGAPYFSYQYIPADGKTKTAFNVEKGAYQVLGTGALISNLSSDSWTRIGMILNLETGEYTLYEYDKASNTYAWKEEGIRKLDDGYPNWIRFSFAERTEASSCSLDLDDYKIYSGTAFADAITGSEPEFDGTYYSQDYDVAKFITADAATQSSSGYDFAQGMDTDGNGYLKVTSKEGVNSESYFRADVTGASEEDSIVAELKLRAGESGTPKLGFYFNRTTAGHTAFSVDDLGDIAYRGDTTIAPITTDSWTQIGFILNRKTGEYTIYRNVNGTYVAMATGSTSFAGGKPTYFGLSIAAPGEGNTREFHLDDFTVYAGSEFRGSDIADGSHAGTVEMNAVIADGVLNIANVNTSDELLNSVLSSDEQLSVLVGEKAVLTLNATNVAEDSGDRTVVNEALAGRTLGSMFTLNLTKQVGETTATEVTSISGDLSFAVTVPDELKNTDENTTRVYDVVCVKGNVVEEVESTFDATEGVITFNTDEMGTFAIMYSDYFYYGDYDAADCNVKADATTSKYSFSQGTDTDGNGYLKVTSINNEAGNFKANITGAAGKSFAAEMKLRASESGVPEFSLYYDRASSAKKAFFVNSNNGVYREDTTISPVGTDAWTQIGLIITDSGTVTIYRYVNGAYIPMASYTSAFAGGKPTYIGFNISAPGEDTTKEFHVDDFKVYEGTTFRGSEIIDLSNAGTVEANAVIAQGALNITSKNATDVLSTPLLSDDDRISVLSGKNAVLTFNVGNVADGSSDRTAVTEALEGRTLGSMFTMSITKQIGEDDATEVTSTNGKLQFEVTIPDNLKNTNDVMTREYQILRVDNGLVTLIESTFNAENSTITFSTDQFGVFAIVYKDQFSGYKEDFNDATTLALTLRSSSALRYEDNYSEQVAAYARAHSSTNAATRADFYGKKVDGDNAYLYMRSSGKITSGNPRYTSFTFSNISVDIGDKPLWIEMDLKVLEKRISKYEFYVNGALLFAEASSTGIRSVNSTTDTGKYALGEEQFNTFSLKFDNGQCYAYINGADEIALGEFTLESFESFQIKIYPDASDVIETGNAGICIDNVAVYTSNTLQDIFGSKIYK